MRSVVGIVMGCLTISVYAQPKNEIAKTYGFVNEEKNVIQNAAHLDVFFEKLYHLQNNGVGRVNIVHIGDSHIQADFLTEVVRKNFQKDFGNAGRGLIVPGRVAGTNEPLNIRTSSSAVWNAKRCVHLNNPLPIGIGGITVNTAQPETTLEIQMRDDLWNYSFNKLTLFFQQGSDSFSFLVQDSAFQELAIIKPDTSDSFKNYAQVTLPNSITKISIQTKKQREEQKQATIFGISLENAAAGVLYHAIGVNGAKYVHYNGASEFSRQTQVLQPDLFIISLGTNESVEYPYIDKNFLQHISKLVQSLSEYNPQAKFMLVTPPDAFRKKIKDNPGIEAVRQQILHFAVENGLAFWDMFKVNGGKNSAMQWKTQGLLRPDGIHFTKDGYVYQGNLLYKAIMKSYNQYVSDRQQ